MTSNQIDHKKELAILALCSEPTITRASEVSNVSRQTLYDWMSEPEFKLALLRARSHAITQASVLLTSRMTQASEWIIEVGENPTMPGARTKLAAARLVLAQAHRFQSDELLLAEAENA